MNYEGLQMV